MEYAEFDTEVRFSYRPCYPPSEDAEAASQRSGDDSGEEDEDGEEGDSDPGILGTLTSILVGGVTDLLTDLSPHNPTTPPAGPTRGRYASTSSTNNTRANSTSTNSASTKPAAITGGHTGSMGRATAQQPSSTHRRGSRPRSPEPAAGSGRGGTVGRHSFAFPTGRESRHRVAATGGGGGGDSHTNGWSSGTKLSRRGSSDGNDDGGGACGGDGGSSWVLPLQQRSRSLAATSTPPVAVPSAGRSRAGGGSGDVAPANSLVGSPTANGSTAGLLGAMFSGISSLGQRATDLLTQLDHDFETIFNGVLEGADVEEGAEESRERNSDIDPRVGATEYTGRRLSYSGDGDGGGTGARRSGGSSALGRDATAATAGTLLAGPGRVGSVTTGSTGGRNVAAAAGGGATRAAAKVPAAAAYPVVSARSTTKGAGGGAIATASGGRAGGTVKGLSHKLDQARSGYGGAASTAWGKRGGGGGEDEDDWGWGDCDNEVGRTSAAHATPVGTSGRGRGAVTLPAQAQTSPGAGKVKAVSIGDPQAGLPPLTIPCGVTAVPSLPSPSLPRSCRSVGTAAALTQPSSARSSRNGGGGGKLIVIKPAAGAAAAAAAARAHTGPGTSTASTVAARPPSSSAATGGIRSAVAAPSLEKAVAVAGDAAAASPSEAVREAVAAAAPGAAPASPGAAIPRAATGVAAAAALAYKSQPISNKEPCNRAQTGVQPTQPTPAVQAVATNAAAAAAGAGVAAFVAEAKAAAKAMAAAAQAEQRGLRQELGEVQRRAEAAEARCGELQRQLEAAEAEAARLGATAESLGHQLAASERRSKELLSENANLHAAVTAATAAAAHRRPVATVDSACSPAATAATAAHHHRGVSTADIASFTAAAAATTNAGFSTPTAASPCTGPSAAVPGAILSRHSSRTHSRNPSSSGGGGGISDELVEATLVAQLTAALAEKARLWRENDILMRRVEGLQELLSYTAQQAAYTHGEGCSDGAGDEDDIGMYGMDPAVRDAVYWYYDDVSTPPPPSAPAEDLSVSGFPASGGGGEPLSTYGGLLYHLADGGPWQGDAGAGALAPKELLDATRTNSKNGKPVGVDEAAGSGCGAADAIPCRDIPCRVTESEEHLKRSGGDVTEYGRNYAEVGGHCCGVVIEAPPMALPGHGGSGYGKQEPAATQPRSNDDGYSGQHSLDRREQQQQQPEPRPALPPSRPLQQQQQRDPQHSQQQEEQQIQQRHEQRHCQQESQGEQEETRQLQEGQQQQGQGHGPPPTPTPPMRSGSYPDGWEVLDEEGEVVVALSSTLISLSCEGTPVGLTTAAASPSPSQPPSQHPVVAAASVSGTAVAAGDATAATDVSVA